MKKQPKTPSYNDEHIEQLHNLFDMLGKDDDSTSGYSLNKETIKKIFDKTDGAQEHDILARLTVIDSMYSTQMNRRYYGLQELAGELYKLTNGNQEALNNKFLQFAKTPVGNTDLEELFSKNYGIGKDGTEKGVAISLISKYAYFSTGFKFPIFDTIACEMYPVVWRKCGFPVSELPQLIIKQDGDKSSRIDGYRTMVKYVEAINNLIKKLQYKKLSYDNLDRFLWFVGKIRRGNLSLILSRKEYEDTLELFPPKKITANKTEYFNIGNVDDLNKLDYLNNNKVLRTFFEIAKIYRYKAKN